MTGFRRVVVAGVLVGVLFSILVLPWGRWDRDQPLQFRLGLFSNTSVTEYHPFWDPPHDFQDLPYFESVWRVRWWRVLVQAVAVVLVGATVPVLVGK